MAKKKSTGPKWDRIAAKAAEKAYRSAAPVIEDEAKKFGQWAVPRAAEAAGKLKAHSILRSNHSRAVQQIDEAVDRLLADPIRAVNLRLTSDTSVEADQLYFNTEVFAGRFGVPQHTAQDIEVIPPRREEHGWSVQVLALFASTMYSLVAVRIKNSSREGLLEFKCQGHAGKIANVVLRNSIDRRDYLPLSTDLPGLIRPGESARGLIAFPKLILPADKLEFEISFGIRNRGTQIIRAGFGIHVPDFDRLPTELEATEGPDTLRSIVHSALEAERQKMVPKIQQAARKVRHSLEGEGSGCMLTMVLLSGSLLLSTVLIFLA